MIFSGRKFIVVHKGEIDHEKLDELESLIKLHGGELVPWKDRVKTDVVNKLIIVAATANYEKHQEMSMLNVPTVTEDWLHACIGEGTIVPTRPYDPDPKNFMKQVMICCSGLSEGDKDAIYSGVKAYGGEYSDNITRFTSHVISSSLDTDECRIAIDSNLDIKIVSPYWFDDCVRLQQYIDATPYLLGKENSLVPLPDLTSQYSGNGDDARLAVQSSVRLSLGTDLFQGRHFFLSGDLDLSTHMATTVKYLIDINGGDVCKDLGQANVYLGKWREGPEYSEACKSRMVVGNIVWLFYMIYHRSWESPLRHLLHYPEVRGGLPEMKDFQISLTNYTGNSRGLLQALVNAIGATYASNLREAHTTHLVCAYPEGQKYAAAKEWGIKIVNHLWLEDCYAQWRLLDETIPRYTHFSPKLNLSHLVGKTQLISSVLKEFYIPDFAKTSREPRQLPTRAAAQKVSNEMPAMMDLEIAALEESKQSHKPAKPKSGTPEINETITNDNDVPQDTEDPKENGAAPKDVPEDAPENAPKEPPTKKIKSAESKSTKAKAKTQTKSKSESPAPTQASTAANSTNEKQNSKPKKLRILFTGLEDPPSVRDCSQLGLSKVESLPADILVAPRPLRTVKFLCALAQTKSFVEPEWFLACKQQKKIVPVDDYLLGDTDLTQALSNRARLDGKGLFEGLRLRVAPIIKSKSDIIQQLVKAHHGTISRSDGASVVTIGGPKIPFEDFLTSISTMNAEILLNAANQSSPADSEN